MPAAYTSAQKKAIADFIAVTASDRSTAAKVSSFGFMRSMVGNGGGWQGTNTVANVAVVQVLKNHNWDTSSAVNTYVTSSLRLS